MRQNLLNEIKDIKDATNAVILTHNIDFIFLQSVVIPTLNKCGNPSVTVFADAQCAEESFAHQGPVLNTIGRRFRVVPVAMEKGFRFHPKAVLLSGPQKAKLFVGSGNLTYGGWRENAEIWINFDSDTDGTGPFAAFLNYLQEICNLIPLNETILAEIEEAFDEKTRPWAENLENPSGLLGKIGTGDPLLSQIAQTLGTAHIDELTVCSPYFDSEAKALQTVRDTLAAAKTTLLVQRGKSGLQKKNVENLSKITITPIDFFHDNKNEARRHAFIHAKFYVAKQGDEVTVFAGSANTSNAALIIPGKQGNAELLAIQRMSVSELQEQYFNEFEILDGDPEFSDLIEKPEIQTTQPSISVLAARFETGAIMIAYSCANEISIDKCLVNTDSVEMEIVERGKIQVKYSQFPRIVQLIGSLNNEIISSNKIWVDCEQELRVTARGRSLEGVLGGRKRPSGQFDIDSWNDIIKVFHQHLKYIPPRVSIFRKYGRDKEKGKKVIEYTGEDVFSDGYGLSLKGGASPVIYGSQPIQTIQQLLNRWFKIPEPEEVDGDDDDPGDSGTGEEPVDKPEKFPTRKKDPAKSKKPNTASQLNRFKKSLGEITEVMTSEKFLEQRPPELLSGDIKLIVILLRNSMKEGWLDQSDFLALTHKIWLSLFFTCELDYSMGSLEYRYKNADSPDEFRERFSSAELTAALASWAMSVTAEIENPEQARFALARALSIARLPWLWHSETTEAIEQELRLILEHTSIPEDNIWEDAEKYWLTMMRQGHALLKLEKILSGKEPGDLKDLLSEEDTVREGELLWQGTKTGFCVALEPGERVPNHKLKVLKFLPDPDKPIAEFNAAFVIPIRSLLHEGIIPISEDFNASHRQIILNFAQELSGAIKDFALM